MSQSALQYRVEHILLHKRDNGMQYGLFFENGNLVQIGTMSLTGGDFDGSTFKPGDPGFDMILAELTSLVTVVKT